MSKRIIEIEGVKLEVDLREAKAIESYKVGDNVKVLVNEGYGDTKDYKVYPGVIIGFEDFKELPTIIVAYLKVSYGDAELKFIYMNSQSKKCEIVPSNGEELTFTKEHVVQLLNNVIEKKTLKLNEAKAKKSFFLKHFNQYFMKHFKFRLT